MKALLKYGDNIIKIPNNALIVVGANAVLVPYIKRVSVDSGTIISTVDLKASVQELIDYEPVPYIHYVSTGGFKVSKLYSLLPNNGSGDLAVDRDTQRVIINSLNEVETIAVDMPAIDYGAGEAELVVVEPTEVMYPAIANAVKTLVVNNKAFTFTSGRDFSAIGLLPTKYSRSYKYRDTLKITESVDVDIDDVKDADDIIIDQSASLVFDTNLGSKVGKLFCLTDAGVNNFDVTRSGTTAMTQNADGTWRVAAANEPRYNADRSLIVEGARTNLLTYPDSFARGEWTKTNCKIFADEITQGQEIVVNGNPFISTGWDLYNGASILNGNLIFGVFGANGIALRNINSIAVNTLLQVKYTIVSNNSTSAIFPITTDFNSNSIFTSQSAYQAVGAAVGDYVFYIPVNALGARTIIGLQTNNSITSGSIVIANFSIKTVQGFDSPFVDANGVNLKNAFKLKATAANGTIKLATALTVTAATTYANSFFIKRALGAGVVSIADINNADKVINVTNDWTRVEYAAEASGTSGQIGLKLATSGDEVMICHAQGEAGSNASTTIGGAEGSQQTRNADVVVRTNAADLIGQTEGTIVVNFFKLLNLDPNRRILFIGDGGTNYNNRIDISNAGTGVSDKLFVGIINNNVTQYLHQSVNSYLGMVKLVLVYSPTKASCFINGVKINESLSAITLSLLSTIAIGQVDNQSKPSAGLLFLNDPIYNVQIYRTALTDAQCIALTTL